MHQIFIGLLVIPTANNHGSLPLANHLPMPTTISNMRKKESNDEQGSGGPNKPTTPKMKQQQ